jgi:hypothetical protein
MFALSRDYNNGTSDASMSDSALSPSSTCPASPLTSVTSSIQYIEPQALPAPQVTHVQFGTANPVDPIILQPLILEDGEIKDIAKSIVPVPFTPSSPTQIQTAIEHFEAIHCARETKGKLKVKEDTTEKATNTTTTIPAASQANMSTSPQFTDSDVECSLGYLFNILHTHHTQAQQPSTFPNQWDVSMGTPTFVDSDSDDDNNDNNDKDNDSDKENWPQPPLTPVHGDNMHPPAWPSHSGEHPGHSWEVNSWGTTHYYRLLICNPITSYYIVAPYITYSINREKPEISGTYGRGHPIVTHALRPMRVNYVCPTITPPQLRLLNIEAPYADAINHVINNYFPYDLSAGVRQYQFYKKKEYQVQCHIRDLQHQEMHYLEKAMGLLSELENANILGRLLAHTEIMQSTICDTDPLAIIPFRHVADTFAGNITQSVTDTYVNVHCKMLKDCIEPDWHHLANNIAIAIQNKDDDEDEVIPAQVPECTRRNTLTSVERLHDGKTLLCTNGNPEHRARVHHRVDSRSSDTDNLFETAAQEIEDHLCRQLHNHMHRLPTPRSRPLTFHNPANHRIKCFRCGQYGHIHATCPHRH